MKQAFSNSSSYHLKLFKFAHHKYAMFSRYPAWLLLTFPSQTTDAKHQNKFSCLTLGCKAQG